MLPTAAGARWLLSLAAEESVGANRRAAHRQTGPVHLAGSLPLGDARVADFHIGTW
jgi:hypothetical protein